jgi:hypothetical protein
MLSTNSKLDVWSGLSTSLNGYLDELTYTPLVNADEGIIP